MNVGGTSVFNVRKSVAETLDFDVLTTSLSNVYLTFALDVIKTLNFNVVSTFKFDYIVTFARDNYISPIRHL